MITVEEYFGVKDHTDEQEELAADLLDRVQALIEEATEDGYVQRTCPNTGTEISGSKGGAGDGGFRSPGAATGAALSSHKEAKAVDVYDPGNHLDDWITDEKLEEHGLYREHPDATPGWAHLTTRPPASGHRTFHP